MEEVAEEVTTGSMSNFEYLLVSAIVHHSYRDTEDWTDVQSFDIDVITLNPSETSLEYAVTHVQEKQI